MFFIEWIKQFRRDHVENATNGNDILSCVAHRTPSSQCCGFIEDSTCFSDFLIYLFCNFNIFDHFSKSTPRFP